MKTISIVIPVYNEAKRIHLALKALQTWKPPKDVVIDRVIFVDDGSSDNSLQIINKSKISIEKYLQSKVEVISYSTNHGKGFAIKNGMLSSTADYTLFLDADMATPLSELSKFLPAMKQRIDVIVGTRKNGHSTVLVHQPKYREILGKIFTYTSNMMLNTWVTDFTCGFKAFSKNSKDKIFEHLTSDSWSFDAEALFLARRMEFSIAEIPVTWSDRKGSKVNVFIDAPKSFWELTMIRIRHAVYSNTSIGAKYRMKLNKGVV